MQNLFTRLAGPVFAKEMLEIARRKRYFFNRVLYGAALLVAVAIVWEANYWRLRNNGPVQIEAMADLALQIFVALGIVQFGAVFFFVPLFVAGLISGEREANSLELLFTTSLTDREIVVGKLASRLAIMGLLILCGVPIVNLILLFGGIAPIAVFRTVTATFLAMIVAGSVTIYFSTVSKSTIAATVRSYWWLTLWLVVTPIVTVMIVNLFRGGPSRSLEKLLWLQAFCNPLFLLITGVVPEAHREISRHLGQWFFPAGFLFPLALSAFLLRRSMVRLRQPPSILFRWGKRWRFLNWLSREGRTARAAAAAFHRHGAERLAFGRNVRNPLWLRARWTPVYDREGHIGRVQILGWGIACIILLLVAFGDSDFPPPGSEMLWLVSFCLATGGIWIAMRTSPTWQGARRWSVILLASALLAPLLFRPGYSLSSEGAAMMLLSVSWSVVFALTAILSATSLAGDRRQGFLDLVLISPLEPREILGGTCLAVLEHLRWGYGFVVLLTLWFWGTGAVAPAGVFATLLTGAAFGGSLLVLGILCSLLAERPVQALIPTFLFGLAMCAGLPIACVMLQSWTFPAFLSLAVVAPLVGWFWGRRSLTPASIATLFFGGHCAFLAIGMLLTVPSLSETRSFRNHPEELVALGVSPLGVIVYILDVTSSWSFDSEANLMFYGYFCAVALNLLLACWLGLRKFDLLAGRVGSETRIAGQLLAIPHTESTGLASLSFSGKNTGAVEVLADATSTETS